MYYCKGLTLYTNNTVRLNMMWYLHFYAYVYFVITDHHKHYKNSELFQFENVVWFIHVIFHWYDSENNIFLYSVIWHAYPTLFFCNFVIIIVEQIVKDERKHEKYLTEIKSAFIIALRSNGKVSEAFQIYEEIKQAGDAP